MTTDQAEATQVINAQSDRQNFETTPDGYIPSAGGDDSRTGLDKRYAKLNRAVLLGIGLAILLTCSPKSLWTSAFPKSALRDVVNAWLEEQRKGSSGAQFWEIDKTDHVQTLFAVRSWAIVDVTANRGVESGGIVTVRVDSSNRGGIPITALWKVYLHGDDSPRISSIEAQ